MALTLKVLLICGSCLSARAAGDDGIIIRKNQRMLDQIERTYSEIPPVRYSAAPDRWKNLARTGDRLLEGGILRVVMLGDSIVNDTSRSCWNLLLEKSCPELRVEKITSVRGSTGCWWYKEPGRVQRYVLDHKPDLVIIGGISHRGDVDSVRGVIGQIRAGSDADILLMTGAFGRLDPRDENQWKTISEPDHYSVYRKGLENLTNEIDVALLDMEAAWGQYIRQSSRDLED